MTNYHAIIPYMADKQLRPALVDDHRQLNKFLLENAVEALKRIFPLENDRYRIELDDVEYPEPEYISPEEVKDAVLAKKTISVPIKGRLTVIDKKTGQVITRTGKKRLVDLPVFTPHYSLIVGGTEYTIFNQIRQRPGVYTRTRATGEVEAKFNLAKGDNFSLVIDPVSKVAQLQLKKGGTIPVVSALRALGYKDEEISRMLGPELVKPNFDKADKFENTVGNRRKLQEFVKSLEETELDPNTTQITLGKSFTKVEPETIKLALQKALRVARGEEEEDHIANLAFKQFLPAEKLLAEALEKKGRLIGQKILARVTQKKQLPAQIDFTPAVHQFVTTSSLSSNPEQTNPIEMLETALKVTYMGEGGIRSSHAIMDEYRDVHPSYTGFLDLIRTSESEKAGVDLRLALGTYFDPETGWLYQKFVNAKTGKVEMLNPQQAYDKKIAFGPNSKVAVYKGKIIQTDNPDYYLPHPSRMFNITTNLVPFLNTDHGNRAQMAAKMWTQAVPLVNREVPKVEIVDEAGRSLSEVLARFLLPKAPEDGRVVEVTNKHVVIQGKSGKRYTIPLYNNYPLSRKTFLNETPTVKPGDEVKKGQVLAESNYTKNGKLALGTNLRVGYMPYKGLNHEDGIVISESAAKKLTSMHMYKEDHELQKDRHIADLNVFKTQFPGHFTKEQLEKLDKFGVVKPGTVLKKGDPIYAFVKKADPTPEDIVLGKLSKDLLRKYQPDVEVWNKDVEGVVKDVYFDGKKLRVTIQTLEPAKEGDKLTLTHGAKGVITKILPDDKMPRTADGKPLEMIITPVSVLARINPGQLYELAVSKVAEKTGDTVKIPAYGYDDNTYERIKNLLQEHGLSDITEKVYDPEDGKWKEIATGPIYVLKLNKLTDLNFSARGPEGEYDVDLRPTKGGEEGSKAIGSMEFYALVSHNVPHLLQEMATFKASKMDDFWNAVMLGKPLPKPRPTFATEKFFAMLRGSGINVEKDAGMIKFLPLTNEDVLRYSSGEIKNPTKLDFKLNPEPGGLFDPTITGGIAGTKWAHIELVHPIVNPVFEEIVDKVLPEWKTLTPEELERKLKALRVEDLYKNETDPKLKRVWRSLKDHGYNNLAEAYLLKYIPVIPPRFRPIIPRGEKDLLVHDANYLYTDVILTNNAIKELKELGMTPDVYHEDYQTLYKNVKALFGLMQPQSPMAQRRGIKGLLAIALGEGKAPKNSYFQSRLMKKLQAPAGRGTLLTDDSLHIDEAGIPEDMAWKLYSPHLVQELTKRGYPLPQAKQMIEDRHPVAKEVLEQKMKEIPIIVNRAPSLWKYNLVALYPKIHNRKGVAINMLIAKGLAGDLDGDTVNVHVPITPQAVEDAKKMLPSRIAVDPRTRLGLLYKPSQEADLGIKLGLTPKENEKPVKVQTPDDVGLLLRSGKIDWRTPVEVNNG